MVIIMRIRNEMYIELFTIRDDHVELISKGHGILIKTD